METPDFSRKPSFETIDEEPEPGPGPLPIEQATELLHVIKKLWTTRENRARGTSSDEVDLDLIAAYRQLEAMCDSLQNPTVAAYVEQTHPDLYFEWWFGCNHLHKMVK